MPKVVVIGLDGAGFHLLDQWLNEDDLPILSGLMDEGSWQRLQSSHPPVTSPAWRCYSTGVNPGKHGVFWWEMFERESNIITVPDSRSYDAKNVWDYLGDEGFASAVVNMPTTYPPEDINGQMIGGGGFEDEYTYPPELQDELVRNIGYKNNLAVPNRTLKDNPKRIKEVNELIDMRFQAAEYLRKTYDPDFLHLSIFITNAIQHYVWGGEALKKMWQRVDHNIGELLEENDNVIIMSDHGSIQIDTIFNINTWLEKKGFLKAKTSKSDVLYKAGLDTETLITLIEKIGMKNFVRRIAPSALLKLLPNSQGGASRDAKEEKLVWDETEAFASGQGPIYVLAEEARKEEVKSEIQTGLEELTSPDGSSIARNVHDASDIYKGPYVDSGPDLVIEQADGVHIPDIVGSSEVFVDPDKWKWDSENHHDGIFMVNGPDISSSGKLGSKPTLYDLTPTILHWYGVEVPEDLDGTVLGEIFEEGSSPEQRAVKYSKEKVHKIDHSKATEQTEEMRNRLQDLGYLSD